MRVINIFLFTFSVCLISCNSDETTFDDYREAWVGTYDCTKSTESFDDTMFTTDIEVIVELDPTEDGVLLINGMRVPVDEDGKFGYAQFEGTHFELTLTDNTIRLSVEQLFIDGFGVQTACFIKGNKS